MRMCLFKDTSAGDFMIAIQVHGVKSITFVDVIERHILPAFQSAQACQLEPATLVSYMAFICLSGLLSTTKFDAKVPDNIDGRRLLTQLQRLAVICTNKGAVHIASSGPIHFPTSLGNQVHIPAVI